MAELTDRAAATKAEIRSSAADCVNDIARIVAGLGKGTKVNEVSRREVGGGRVN